eukprot:5966781-Ditylum_brightwellii.AAC.1
MGDQHKMQKLSSMPRKPPISKPIEQLSSKQKLLDQEQIKIMWTNKGETSNTQLDQAIEEIL